MHHENASPVFVLPAPRLVVVRSTGARNAGRCRRAARRRQAAPAPFPAGAKIAYVNLQAIAGNSAEGKADNTKVEALVKRKQGEAPANQKTPQEAQKFQQDAQAEVQKLQADLRERLSAQAVSGAAADGERQAAQHAAQLAGRRD